MDEKASGKIYGKQGVNDMTEKNNKKHIPYLQSGLILILIVMVITMMVQISHLQGTARVVNYAGLVRGATQRTVKLEITGDKRNDLIHYLDQILSGLKYEDGNYDLVRLDDKNYQKRLDEQMAYWKKLKKEIRKVREKGYDNTDIVEVSERYFEYADRTVTAAEKYSEKIARRIRTIEYITAFDMALLVILMISQYMQKAKMMKANKVLEQKAYIDVHTGLPNKSRCEELLRDTSLLEKATGCVVFDLNNLKTVNDSLGHTAGDSLISNFARIVRNVIPPKDYVGRYGGDEFMAVIYETDEQHLQEIMQKLQEEIDKFNQYGKHVPISYASGWALSTAFKECTLRTLFDKADHSMYLNKQRQKKEERE